MNKSLLAAALSRFLAGAILLGALLFIPAGTLHYPDGQRFLLLLLIPMLLLGIALYLKAPSLLEKRLRSREKDPAQQKVTGFCAALLCLVFALSGLDFRFSWSNMPDMLKQSAGVLQLLAYALYAEVMRENAFLSRTIEIQEQHRVVDTGLYGLIRHPMYAATILLFLSMPLVLGSFIAFGVMLLYPACIIVRIRHEEAFLKKHLDGYAAYMQRVRYRLFPLIW
ncbi:MAG: isoprenylcysteine carboxylmethyltransferase family protein [Clostridia bacterium]|nr:isoprenylcysteine carboxylmethyltransferase family protein [Clostridia bacterium]